MKPRLHLWMLKPKSSESSGCTHIHQTSRKSLNKPCLPARKLMETVFWVRKRMLMVEFMQQGTTITSEVYCETLKRNVRRTIRNKRRRMLTPGVVLLHNNARPHTAPRTREQLEHFNWELFVLPPYRPDLAPSDYHLFTYVKTWLWSQHFSSNEELMESVKTWLGSQTSLTQAYRNVFPDTSVSIPAVATLRSDLSVHFFILWRIDTLLDNAWNTQEANSTGAVFSLCPCTDCCYATRVPWRHTTLDRNHVICVFCNDCPCSVYITGVCLQPSFRFVEYSSKMEEYRRVQVVSLWRLNVWFEDFIFAVVQWYLECNGYSSCVKMLCQETDSENIVKE
jgi:transposase